MHSIMSSVSHGLPPSTHDMEELEVSPNIIISFLQPNSVLYEGLLTDNNFPLTSLFFFYTPSQSTIPNLNTLPLSNLKPPFFLNQIQSMPQ